MKNEERRINFISCRKRANSADAICPCWFMILSVGQRAAAAVSSSFCLKILQVTIIIVILPKNATN